MYQLFTNLSRKQKIGFAIIIGLIPLIIVVSITMMIMRVQPIVKIRNIDEYFANVTEEEKTYLQESLYKFLNRTFGTENRHLEAVIRNGTFIETRAEDWLFTNFIIDIDELKMSYDTSFEIPYINSTSQNPVFDCPALSEMKYPETECVGMYNSSVETRLEAENPIYAILPISVDEFDVNAMESIKYDIYGITDNEDGVFLVRIIDYSGGSYEAALNTIREKGFNPEDYTIEYISYYEE